MDISAMDPKDIPGLFDAEVVGPDGEKVGTIQQIFADEVTGAATFVTVLSQGHEYFIPVRGAEYSTSQVNVPFSRNLIETAPEASEEDDLSRDREAEVVWGANFAVRRSAIERIGEFDESIVTPHGDEEEWLERLRAAGGADVVHFHNTFPLISPAAYYAARGAGAAVVPSSSRPKFCRRSRDAASRGRPARGLPRSGVRRRRGRRGAAGAHRCRGGRDRRRRRAARPLTRAATMVP